MRYVIAPMNKVPSRFPKPGRDVSLFAQLGDNWTGDTHNWDFCEAGPFALAWVYDDARDLSGLTGVVVLPQIDPVTTRFRDLSAAERQSLLDAYAELPDKTRVPMPGGPNATLAEAYLALVGNRTEHRYDEPSDSFVLDGEQWPQMRPLPWQMAGGAFPNTVVLDNFNVSDVNPYLPATLSPLFSSGNGNLRVVSLQVASDGLQQYAEWYWNVAVTSSADSEAYCATWTSSGSPDDFACWVKLHNGTPPVNGMFGQTNVGGGTPDKPAIYRQTGGSPTLIASDSSKASSGTHAWGLGSVGSSFTLYKDGASWITGTDATYSAIAGYVGWSIKNTTGRADDYGGGPGLGAPGSVSNLEHQFPGDRYAGRVNAGWV